MTNPAATARARLWGATAQLQSVCRVGSAAPISLGGYVEALPALWVASRDSGAMPTPDDLYLVVEILASDTLDAGLELEALIGRYEEAGIREVWVINLVERCIVTYHRPEPDRPFRFQLHELPTTPVVTHASTQWRLDVAGVLGPP